MFLTNLLQGFCGLEKVWKSMTFFISGAQWRFETSEFLIAQLKNYIIIEFE